MRLIRMAVQPRASFAQRLLIFAVAVAGILVGLLAMHTMNSDRTHTSAGAAPSAVTHQEALHSGSTAPDLHGGGCEGTCPAPVHDMLAMACILVLVITLLVVGAPIVISAAPERPTTLPTLWQAHAARPRPPSLHALSISRT